MLKIPDMVCMVKSVYMRCGSLGPMWGTYREESWTSAEIAAGIVPVSWLRASDLFLLYNSYNAIQYLKTCGW